MSWLIKRVHADRKVDIKLPGKGNSDPHGARPVYKNYFDD
jgi:hypothetical protein